MDADNNNSPLLPNRIPQLTKSNSTASGRSVSSHKSVKVLGAHPFGSLHVHDAAAAGSMEDPDDDDDDDDEEAPPPLDIPAGQDSQTVAGLHPSTISPRESPTSPSSIPHDMGGGDVVLILDLPDLFTIGCDAISFTAKHFGGLRDIPLGPHFFWVSHPTGLSARYGFWVNTTGVDTVHVMQWDKFNEILTESAHAEARIQVDNLNTFHSKLPSYSDPSTVNSVEGTLTQSDSQKNLDIWKQLTGYISEDLLSRVTGQGLNSWLVHTGDRVNGSILNAAEMRLDSSLASPILKTRELNFAFDQRSKSYSTASTGAQRTQLAMDSTHYISYTIDGSDDKITANDLIGELQFAFIVGVHLGNDSCIQQWWHMVLRVFLRAHLLPSRNPTMASAFIRTLNAQVSFSSLWLEGSIFDQADSRTRELRLALTVYKRRLDEMLLALDKRATPDQLAVGNAFTGLEATVVSNLDWDLRGDYLRRGNVMMEDGEQVELEVTDLEDEDERGDWAPTVVDIDESGRQSDLVSWQD